MTFLISLLLTFSCMSNASEEKVTVLDNDITAELGYKQAAPHFGASYIRGTESIGFGGYFLFQSESDSGQVPRANQLLSFGPLAKFYVMNTPKATVYVAPGIGINNIRNFYDISAGNPNKTDLYFFGVVFKIGGQLSITPKLKMGLEYTKITNWCEDEITDYLNEYTSLTMTFLF